MSPDQRKLARHALGLDNPDAKGRSYRNRYFVHHDSPAWAAWFEMVVAGDAAGWLHPGRADTEFALTTQGARAAIDATERLDPEDFPEAAE